MKNIRSVILLLLLVGFCISCGIQKNALPATPEPTVEVRPEEPSPTVPGPTASATQEIPTQTVETTSTPGVTPTPQPLSSTITPTRTIQPTEEVAFAFQELIFFGEGGGGGGCFPYNRPLPLVDRNSGYGYPNRQDFAACLLGLPGGELVELAVIDPRGQEIPWMEVRIPDQVVYDSTYNESFTLVELPGLVSLALGSPDWRLAVKFSGGSLAGFLFDPQPGYWWQEGDQVVTHSRFPTGTRVNPFEPTLRAPYREGDTVYLQGMNFTPNSRIPMGLYQGVLEMHFVRPFSAETDAQGQFETELIVGPELQDGTYSVIPSEMFNPDDLSQVLSGAFATFQVQNELPYAACPDSPESSLLVGDRAIQVDDVANNLRAGPGLDEFYPVLGKIQPGEQVQVLGGPQCAYGYTWWLVLNEDNRLVGWTAEADPGETWLRRLE